MPIYEYECGACGHTLESFQKMSEAPLTECPKCHKPALQKLVSAAGFQLKGTGWYVTDFRGDKNKPATTTSTSNTDTASTPASSDKAKTDSGSSSTGSAS